MADDPSKVPTRVPHVLEDPSAQAVARVYAEALLGAAGTGADEVLGELESFLTEVLAKFPQFEEILLSGVVGREEKEELINRVVAPRASDVLTNFFRVLARHDRLELLPYVLKEARTRHEIAAGKRHVTLTTARRVSDTQLKAITSQLEVLLPFQPIVDSQVDEKLLGGMVIRVGDTVYDASLRARMKQLRSRLRARSLHEIQSRRDRFSTPEGD